MKRGSYENLISVLCFRIFLRLAFLGLHEDSSMKGQFSNDSSRFSKSNMKNFRRSFTSVIIFLLLVIQYGLIVIKRKKNRWNFGTQTDKICQICRRIAANATTRPLGEPFLFLFADWLRRFASKHPAGKNKIPVKPTRKFV